MRTLERRRCWTRSSCQRSRLMQNVRSGESACLYRTLSRAARLTLASWNRVQWPEPCINCDRRYSFPQQQKQQQQQQQPCVRSKPGRKVSSPHTCLSLGHDAKNSERKTCACVRGLLPCAACRRNGQILALRGFSAHARTKSGKKEEEIDARRY